MGSRRLKKGFKKSFIKFTVTIILILSLLLIHYKFLSLPLIASYAESRVNETVSLILNEAAKNVLAKADYKDFVDIRESNGIKILNIDTASLNLMVRLLCYEARENLVKSGSFLYLSAGIFSGIAYFSETGPKIKITTENNGKVNGKLQSVFKSLDSDKTLHSLYIQISVETDILLPLYEKTVKNDIDILVCENIIIGNAVVGE